MGKNLKAPCILNIYIKRFGKEERKIHDVNDYPCVSTYDIRK